VDDQKAQAVMQELVASGQVTDPDSPRGKLLQEAARLFRRKGYERTTVRDLANAVGIPSLQEQGRNFAFGDGGNRDLQHGLTARCSG
jgi:hypothetical protein